MMQLLGLRTAFSPEVLPWRLCAVAGLQPSRPVAGRLPPCRPRKPAGGHHRRPHHQGYGLLQHGATANLRTPARRNQAHSMVDAGWLVPCGSRHAGCIPGTYVTDGPAHGIQTQAARQGRAAGTLRLKTHTSRPLPPPRQAQHSKAADSQHCCSHCRERRLDATQPCPWRRAAFAAVRTSGSHTALCAGLLARLRHG